MNISAGSHRSGVLGFTFPQPLGICCRHAAELGPPLAEPCIAETALVAQLFYGHPGVRLFEDANDLLSSYPSFSSLMDFATFTLVRGQGSGQML